MATVNKKRKTPQKLASADSSIAVSPKFEERRPDLDLRWQEIEKRLLNLREPRHVRCECKDQNQSRVNHEEDRIGYVGIADYEGEWHLCGGLIRTRGFFVHQDIIWWLPIDQCSFEHQIAAAQRIAELEKEIVKVDEMLADLNKAIACLDERLADI